MSNLLQDLWMQIQSYYGNIVTLLPKIAMASILFAILLAIANYSSRLAHRRLQVRLKDPLLARFIARTIKIIILIVALLLVLNIIGLGGAATGLLGTAGVSAFVIGFAFKDIGEHLLAGILLAFDRPFRVGDTVELDGMKGKVILLNLRNTQIKTSDGKDVYIPNGNIVKNPLINYTIDGFMRYELEVGIDYGSDIDQAIAVIKDVLPKIDGILQNEKAPSVHLSSLGTSTINLQVFYWLDTFDTSISGMAIKTKMAKEILEALTTAGFYMPGDIVELKNYNKESLATAS